MQLAKYHKLVNKLSHGGSNISGEINYPPMYSAFNADKIFQGSPNNSEIFKFYILNSILNNIYLHPSFFRFYS